MNRFRQIKYTPLRDRLENPKRPLFVGLLLLCWTLLWGLLFLPTSHAAGPLLPKRQAPKRPATKKSLFSLNEQFGTSDKSGSYAISRDSLIQQVSFNDDVSVNGNQEQTQEDESAFRVPQPQTSLNSNHTQLDLDLQEIFNDIDSDTYSNNNPGSNRNVYIDTDARENEEEWNENEENEEIELNSVLSQDFVDSRSHTNTNYQSQQSAQVALAAGALPPATFAQPPKYPSRTLYPPNTEAGDESDSAENSTSAEQTPGLSPNNPYALMYPDSVQSNLTPQNSNFSGAPLPYALSLNQSALGQPAYAPQVLSGSAVGSPYSFSNFNAAAQPNGYMSGYNQAAFNGGMFNNASAYQTAGYPYGAAYASPYPPYSMGGYMGAGHYAAQPAMSGYAPTAFHRYHHHYESDEEVEFEDNSRYYSLSHTMMETLCYFNPMNLPKGPDRGVGGPMMMRSWKDRPFYIGFFGGVMFGDDLISGLVDQDDGGTGGITFGWNCDHYWGIESRLHFTGLPGKDTPYGRQKFQEWYQASFGGDYVPPTSSRNNAITLFDVSVHYYPLGNAKWRPYLKLGVGVAGQSFRDVYGYKHDYNSLVVPVGIGLKYWWNERVSVHMEFVDNIVGSTGIVDTQNNLALTFGLDFPIGRIKRREPVVYWPYTPSAK